MPTCHRNIKCFSKFINIYPLSSCTYHRMGTSHVLTCADLWTLLWVALLYSTAFTLLYLQGKVYTFRHRRSLITRPLLSSPFSRLPLPSPAPLLYFPSMSSLPENAVSFPTSFHLLDSSLYLCSLLDQLLLLFQDTAIMSPPLWSHSWISR